MIAFLSDIHGNLPALRAVCAELDRLGCGRMICLGDVAGYYTQVNECIELLRERNCFCLLGNHDKYLLTSAEGAPKTVQICIAYQKTVIREEQLEWLAGNPSALDLSRFSLRHAGWRDPLEERFDRFDFTWVGEMPQTLYLSGHTHIQYLQRAEDGLRTYCNPGSVGQPRDGDPAAAYAVLEEGGLRLCRAAYDVDETVFEMKKHGLGDWIWKGLYTGKQIGRE